MGVQGETPPPGSSEGLAYLCVKNEFSGYVRFKHGSLLPLEDPEAKPVGSPVDELPERSGVFNISLGEKLSLR